MQAYRIVDWKRRYEIKADKRDAGENTPDDQLRRKPHDFIKWRVFGHKLGHKYRTLTKKAWRPGEINELAVIGFFGKLLELAGDQESPQYRGWILDEDQQPMDVKAIAELLDIQEVGRLTEAMGMLIDVGWVEKSEFLQNLQRPAKIAGVSGKNCSPLIKETETEENISKTKEASENSPDFSDSVSNQKAHLQIADARAKALKEVLRILQVDPSNQSDLTTFRDIFDQLEGRIVDGVLTAEIFDAVVDEAAEAVGHRFKKIARFVNAMKLPRFGYMPVKREVLGSKYR